MRWAGWAALLCMAACGGAHPGGSSSGGGSDTIPDGGTSGGGGGPDAGPAPECASLMPAAPRTAVTFDITTPGATCGASMTDGEGVAACDVESSKRQWLEYGENGIKSGTFEGPVTLLPQPAGFMGIVAGARVQVALWDRNGGIVGASDVTGDAIALGPAWGSGAIALVSGSGTLEISKLDQTSSTIASTTIPSGDTPIAAAEDASGAILAVTAAGNDVSGAWVDLARKSAGQRFRIGTATAVAARALLDGGIAVQLDGRWAGVLRPGETALQQPPSWIGPAADVVPVLGEKAYALVPATGNRVEIVSAQGNSCGFVTFPGVSTVNLGVDGSVIGSTGTRGCTKVVWRNILR